MSTVQCLELPSATCRSDPAHGRYCSGAWLGFGALFGLLTFAGAGGLSAQSRGDLQVGARVLASGPSQSALASALNRPSPGTQIELADISRAVQATPIDSAGVALPPRSVVTIAFLRN